jgi:Tol biopolymer transport system component
VQPAGVVAFRRFTDPALTTSSIVTSRLDGSDQRILTAPAPGGQDTLPAWSSDGKRLAFMRISPGPGATAEVYVVERTGGPVRQLTRSPAGSTCEDSAGPQPAAPSSSISCNGDPSWSPDGSQLAYSHRSRKNSVSRSEIWVLNQDGTGGHVLIAGGLPARDSSPAWSPDGTRIAFEHVNDDGTSSIVVVRADGSGERQLTASGKSFGDHAAWSPDGDKLLFRSNPGNPTQAFHTSDLYTVRADGTDLTQLNQSDRNLEFLSSSWSPDGKWIVTGLVQRGSGSDRAQLYVLTADATQKRLVIDNPYWQSAPRWMPGHDDAGS